MYVFAIIIQNNAVLKISIYFVINVYKIILISICGSFRPQVKEPYYLLDINGNLPNIELT